MTNPPRRAPRTLATYEPTPSVSATAEAGADPQPAAQAPRAKAKLEGAEGVPLSILVSAKDRKRLRQLALDKEVSLQALGIRAWTLLLEAEGLAGLEPQTANRPSGRKRD